MTIKEMLEIRRQVESSGGGSSGNSFAFINFQESSTGNYTADKTIDELGEYIDRGILPIARINAADSIVSYVLYPCYLSKLNYFEISADFYGFCVDDNSTYTKKILIETKITWKRNSTYLDGKIIVTSRKFDLTESTN